jgi:hypothetical protein
MFYCLLYSRDSFLLIKANLVYKKSARRTMISTSKTAEADLDMANRYSSVLDRYENGEDVRTEISSVLSEGFIIFSDCADVRDRLFQDPAVKFQTDYLNDRLSALGLDSNLG